MVANQLTFNRSEPYEIIKVQGCHSLDDIPPGWIEKTMGAVKTFSRDTTHVSVSEGSRCASQDAVGWSLHAGGAWL
jgi:hypothetical protein